MEGRKDTSNIDYGSLIDVSDNLDSCLSPILFANGKSPGKSQGYNSAMLPEFKGLSKENKSLKKKVEKLEKNIESNRKLMRFKTEELTTEENVRHGLERDLKVANFDLETLRKEYNYLKVDQDRLLGDKKDHVIEGKPKPFFTNKNSQ